MSKSKDYSDYHDVLAIGKWDLMQQIKQLGLSATIFITDSLRW